MSEPVARFTISVPPELLSTFDEVCAGKGYSSRSEAVRDALRDYLVAHEWSADGEAKEVVGTLTLLCDRDSRLPDDLQRRQGVRVLSSMRVPLEAGDGLEVIVLRGLAAAVTAAADSLISQRGVKHGRLVCASAGADLP
jgi:CopG family nickel-responsive transcriptional regulator